MTTDPTPGGLSLKINGFPSAFTKSVKKVDFCSYGEVYGVVNVFCKKDIGFSVHHTLGWMNQANFVGCIQVQKWTSTE